MELSHKTEFVNLLRIFAMYFVCSHCLTQEHNSPMDLVMISSSHSVISSSHLVDNSYTPGKSRSSVDNEKYVQLNLPYREQFPFIPRANIFPTALTSRFLYAPSPSEASDTIYRLYSDKKESNSSGKSDFSRLLYGRNSISMGDNNGFSSQEETVSSAANIKLAENDINEMRTLSKQSVQLPAPEAFSDHSDWIPPQSHRFRSPCLAAKLDWVRDQHNCSVFFVCAHGRVAAVLTCPHREVWSNRVTNCVPIRSRWDDCVYADQNSLARDEQFARDLRSSTLRPDRNVRRWRTTSVTTPAPAKSDTENESRKEPQNVDNNNEQESQQRHIQQQLHNRKQRRSYFRRPSKHGRYYQNGSRRLNLITKSRRGGYRIHKIQSQVERIRNPGRTRQFVTRSPISASNSPKGGSDIWEGRIFPHSHQSPEVITESTGNINRQLQHHLLGHQTFHSETFTTNPTSIDETSVTTSSSINSPDFQSKVRHRFPWKDNRKRKQRFEESEIKPVKELDFMYNIKRIKLLENDERFRFSRQKTRAHETVDKDKLLPGKDAKPDTQHFEEPQWWLEVTTLPATSSTTTTATTIVIATTAERITAPVTTQTEPLPVTTPTFSNKARNISHPKYIPECGVSATSMIIGGLPARQGRWPWVVSLQLTWNRNHVCGGTLVHPQWIVTAAHCVNGPDLSKADEWRALFWQQGSSKEIDVIVQHPDFVNGDNYPNDIALLRLHEPVDVSGFDLRHACLPKYGALMQQWEKCWIMGWGESKDDVKSELKELEVKIRKNSECSARWGWKRILNSHVCAGNGERGACNGDSGGPLICRRKGYHFLAGVTSWGVGGCQTTGYPSVFTRVAFYHNWIQTVINAFS